VTPRSDGAHNRPRSHEISRGRRTLRTENQRSSGLTETTVICIIYPMETTRQKTNLFVDPDLWRALRVRALEEGMTTTDLLNRIIAAYVGRKAPATQKRTTQKARA
jgi:hypothetical protein